MLDRFEDDIAALSLHLKKLSAPSVTAETSAGKQLSRKLIRVKRHLEQTSEGLSMTEEPVDVLLLEQYQEKMSDVKKDLSVIYEEIVTLDLDDDHDLVLEHTKLEKSHFDCSLSIKKLLSSHTTSSSSSPMAPVGKTSKLPKLDVPAFDGDVLRWQTFWEQFETSIHSRSSLSDAEKLVYLQQAIKTGSARSAIEGLSHTGDQYAEAVSCLKARYDRPRVIHRAHVRTIVDTPSLRDGSGKELRRLHDTLQQHLRALKTMKCEPDPSFITSMIELKLDDTTSFEWQKHSQEKVGEVPHYEDILEFLNLRAQASESLTGSSKKSSTPSVKKGGKVASFAVSNAESDARNHCVICTSERHPLYTCPKFKAMSHDDKTSTLKGNKLCLNCLGSGHFVKQCKSSHRCRKCQRPHHTLLHVESLGNSPSQPPDPSNHPPAQAVSNTAVKLKSSALLMTCRVLTMELKPGHFWIMAQRHHLYPSA